MKNNFSKIFLLFAVLAFSSCAGKTNKGSFSLSDVWVGEPDSGFRDLKIVEGKKYMVASASEASSQAGAQMLAKGGNAIDAMIATQLVLNVVEPHSSGIGGGAFLLYYDKKSGQTIYFNGRETAPAKAKSDIFLDANGKPRQFNDVVQGGLSVGTPGALKLMKETHALYGKLPWAQLFDPAIKVAREGFVVSERFHNLSKSISYLKKFDETAEIYLKENGKPYEVGEKITNKKLAKTFEKIAKEGINDFYSGKIANDIVTAVQNSKTNPGYLSLNDLKNYRLQKGKLVCIKYRGKYKVCTMPLPSSGSTVLQSLGILENFDLAKLKPNSVEAVHLIVEATRLAYADRNEYFGDTSIVPLRRLINKNYLKSRAALIDVNHAMTKVEAGKFAPEIKKVVIDNKAAEMPSTTHMSIVDAEGNAVSMTSSIEYFFGSALSVDGFLLNNQLTDFAFEPKKNGKLVANRLEPGKQPRSSMSPVFVFDNNGALKMVVGSPGGPRIIQFVTKAIVNQLDFGLDAQAAISLPSFVVLNDVVELERGQNITKIESALNKMGHETKVIEIVSGISAVTIEKGKVSGAVDPRREGVAVGK
ncbi:MAG: gamma-glutamyltransferase [Rickettsiales bacterium]|nr:gamma-glutamyltransferase [Rickettsiales bacterium]